MGVSWTVCPGWPPTVIALISASQLARITGMSHSCLATHIKYQIKQLWKEHNLSKYKSLSLRQWNTSSIQYLQ
jgi:hypothetical protein